jgi:hypothetical protein
MWIITSDEEAAPWSRCKHVIGPDVPPIDDNDNNFSGIFCTTELR